MTILNKIVARKKQEVGSRRQITSIEDLQQKPLYNRKTNSFKQHFTEKGIGIIAEFKRQSPSKGVINDRFSSVEVAEGYVQSGVAGMSILTDLPFFGGQNKDLTSVRKAYPDLPILRKDFIISPYQIHEAKSIGADMILLIAACLSAKEMASLTKLAHELGLEVLVEVHNEDEAKNIPPNTDLTGVNNRNLKSFEVSIQNSIDLIDKLPPDAIKISESGISDVNTIVQLSEIGYKGFLIGENFMKSDNPAVAAKTFLTELNYSLA